MFFPSKKIVGGKVPKKTPLTVQLPAHGQERRLSEEVGAVVDFAVGGGAREPADHDRRGRDGGSVAGGGGSSSRSCLFLALGLLLLRGLFAPRRGEDLFLGLVCYC